MKSFATRRAWLLGCLAALGCIGASAQTASQAPPAWPSKPVKFVNSWPAGGPSDILARAVGDVLQKQFGQPFIVDNKPGAAGNVGADLLAKSAPDGHTLAWGIDTTHTINPHIYKSLPFKDSDLKPLVVVSSSGLLLGVHPSTGIKTAKDWLQAARERSMNFSSGGNGSPGHLWVNMANIGASTRLVHVPYRGNTPAVMAVLSGEVDGGTLATPGMLPHVKAGKITPLAVTSQKRSRLAPEVPTVGELGLKDLESEVLYLVMAPGNTPEPLMQTMAKAITDALARPEVQARINDLDMRYEGLTGSAAASRLKKLSDQYGRIIRATGMKVD
jgi:tripartite-type tricarboxylate transporter receptor subunit TctC